MTTEIDEMYRWRTYIEKSSTEDSKITMSLEMLKPKRLLLGPLDIREEEECFASIMYGER